MLRKISKRGDAHIDFIGFLQKIIYATNMACERILMACIIMAIIFRLVLARARSKAANADKRKSRYSQYFECASDKHFRQK